MPSVNFLADATAVDLLRHRLPEGFIIRLPRVIRDGYRNATSDGPTHVASRRRACDRHFSIQSAWHALGTDFEEVKVIAAMATNGGGPYYALECNGVLMTIHKVDEENAPPRQAVYRARYSRTAKGNEKLEQLVLDDVLDHAPLAFDPTAMQLLGSVRKQIMSDCDIYTLVTHKASQDGEAPEFIHAIVINSSNQVLASVDLGAEAQAIILRRMAEEQVATAIHEPQQRRRKKGREEAN